MTYMVMETHFSYAVVLDEGGNFLRVANMGYEIGDRIKSVFPMEEEEEKGEALSVLQTEDVKKKEKDTMQRKGRKKIWLSVVTAAACILLMFTVFTPADMEVTASVYMTINPEIRMDLNQKDIVVGLEGVNEDGTELIDGYEYKKKTLQEVMDDLIDRAIEMGFLYEGGELILDLDAEDEEWIQITGVNLRKHLADYLEGKISVTTKIRKYDSQSTAEDVVNEGSITTDSADEQQDEEEQDSGYRETVNSQSSSVPQAQGNSSGGGDRPVGDSQYGNSDYQSPSVDDGNSDYEEDEEEMDEDEPDEEENDEEDDFSEAEEEGEGDSAYGDSEYD